MKIGSICSRRLFSMRCPTSTNEPRDFKAQRRVGSIRLLAGLLQFRDFEQVE